VSETDRRLCGEPFSKRDPAIPPKAKFTSAQERHPLIFGLHERTVGTVINKYKKLLPVFNTGVRSRGVNHTDSEVSIIGCAKQHIGITGQSQVSIVPIQNKL
jgi:hypothetical protein